MKKVSVSFLSSKDVINDLIDIEASCADYIHVDVMDGKFVKNKNLPFKVLDRMSYILNNKRLDVHLMVKEPLKFIEKYATLNCEYITVHVELGDISSYLDLIKSYGIKCGIAINPDTDISLLEKYLDRIDLILVMSVFPGAGGQSFIEESTNRIAEIKKMIGKRKILVNVDGGINDKTISKVRNSDIVVSGSFIINSDDFDKSIKKLK